MMELRPIGTIWEVHRSWESPLYLGRKGRVVSHFSSTTHTIKWLDTGKEVSGYGLTDKFWREVGEDAPW